MLVIIDVEFGIDCIRISVVVCDCVGWFEGEMLEVVDCIWFIYKVVFLEWDVFVWVDVGDVVESFV